jgi:hypothetical protein
MREQQKNVLEPRGEMRGADYRKFVGLFGGKKEPQLRQMAGGSSLCRRHQYARRPTSIPE